MTEPMTEPELRALAWKIAEGKVYGMWNVPQDLWLMVFMPLAWCNKRELMKHKDDCVYAIYGEDDTVPGRAINGYPMFTAFRFLPRQYFDRVNALIVEARVQRAAFLGQEWVSKTTNADSPELAVMGAGATPTPSGRKKVQGVPRTPQERGEPTKAQRKKRPRKRRTP